MNAEEWNTKYPIGTKVRYWPATRDGIFTDTVTWSKAWETGDGTPIVKIKGRTGGVALSHLEPLISAEESMREYLEGADFDSEDNTAKCEINIPKDIVAKTAGRIAEALINNKLNEETLASIFFDAANECNRADIIIHLTSKLEAARDTLTNINKHLNDFRKWKDEEQTVIIDDNNMVHSDPKLLIKKQGETLFKIYTELETAKRLYVNPV